MHLLRAAAALALTVALVSGCGDDDPEVAPPEQSTQVSTPTEATSEPTHTPTKPVLPDAAKKPTKAGAEAFIHYYWDVVNYAQETGRTARLRKISGGSCQGCNAFIDAVRSAYGDGGYVTDGDYRATIQKLTEVSDKPTDPYAVEVLATVHNQRHEAVDGSGESTPFAESDRKYVFYVLWVADNWRLDIWEDQ